MKRGRQNRDSIGRADHRSGVPASQDLGGLGRRLARQHLATGNDLLATNQTRAAVGKYAAALQLAPELFEGWSNLGCALARLGEARATTTAIECFARCLTIKPGYAPAHNNLGGVLARLGRLDDALGCYQRALALAPDYVDAHFNLAGALLQLERTAEAAVAYQRVLALAPGHSGARTALVSLADLLQIAGRADEAATLGRFLAALKNDDWPVRLRLALNPPLILESMEQARTVRTRTMTALRQLRTDGIGLKDPFADFGKTNFYFAYHGLDDLELQRATAELHLAACPELAWTAPHCRMRSRRRRRLRLGVISAHLSDHTIGKLFHGIIRELSRREFEVVLMRAARPPDLTTGQIDALADGVIEYPGTLIAAREAIAAAAPDILFYPEIGMDELTYYLAFARLALVQCVTWGHPVTSGIPAIDYFISAEMLEPAGAAAHYSERLVRLAHLPAYYMRPRRVDAPLSHADLGLSLDATLYLCPQSLFKFHPDFDTALAAILGADPRARILLLRGRHQHWQTLLRERFRETLGTGGDRMVFLDRLSQAEFFRLVLAADVMLDPFHFGGGNSTYEALGLGVPVVTWPGAFMRGRVTLGCYRQMGMTDLIATDAEAYAQMAVAVANESAGRAERSATIAERAAALYEDRAVVTELEEFLLAAYEAASGGATRIAWGQNHRRDQGEGEKIR